MTVPVFEEYEPAGDCVCPGCARQRRERARALPVRAGGHPAARGARRALVLVTAAGAVLSGGGSGALAAPGAGHSPPPDPEAAAPRAAPPAARPAGGDVRADRAAPAPPPRGKPAAGTHRAPAGDPRGKQVRPEQARASTAARARTVPARTDRARVGPAGADRPAAVRLRAGGPAVSRRTPGPDPETPQGGQGPLHGGPVAGPAGTAGLRTMARADIMNRAKRWVNAKVPYSMSRYWADGYRQDCSGYVSMAWHLPGNEWTGSLAEFGTRIERKDLKPGDILLFHNPDDPSQGSHVTIFGGWADGTHTKYVAYEQAKPHTRRQTTPMAYWNNSSQYQAYRYKALKGVDTAGGQLGGDEGNGFPGAGVFGPGEDNAYVALLGRLLAGYGFDIGGTAGPGSRWGEAHRQATQAFQRAQGWAGAEADGVPGPDTWSLLVNGTGRKAAPAPPAGTAPSGHTAAPPAGTAHGAAPPAGTGPAAGPVPTGPRKAAPPAGVPARPGTAPPATAAARKAAPPATTAPRKAAPPAVAATAPAFPGHGHFRPGSSGGHVDTLRRQLVKRGFGRHYSPRPGPRWGDADRRSVEAFQRAQGWRGAGADGYPGPETWRRLFS